jgi:hypothetical protein
MPSEDKPSSHTKAIVTWVGLAVSITTAAIAVLQFRKTDIVTPYQQQVHAACNHIQQIDSAAEQTILQGVVSPFSYLGGPISSRGPEPSLSPGSPLRRLGFFGFMSTPLVPKAVAVSALQSNYDSTKLEFDLLDQRTTPPVLTDQKRRQEAAKNAYLATLHTALQEAQRFDDITALSQVLPLIPNPASAVEINDSMTALAGGDCIVTPRVTAGGGPQASASAQP